MSFAAWVRDQVARRSRSGPPADDASHQMWRMVESYAALNRYNAMARGKLDLEEAARALARLADHHGYSLVRTHEQKPWTSG